MKFTLLRSLRHQDKTYRKGDEIELDDELATRFSDRKWILLEGKPESKQEANKKRRDRKKAVTPSDSQTEAQPEGSETETPVAEVPEAEEPASSPSRKRPGINADAV